MTVDYNSDGILEFRASKEVEEYGWKVFVTKPRSMAMKTYSSMGFGIFLLRGLRLRLVRGLSL